MARAHAGALRPDAFAALVLYARVPRPGRVKTRMMPWLGEGEALRLHLALVEDSLRLLRAGASLCAASPVVSFSEPWDPSRRRGCAGIAREAAGMSRRPQKGSDLGGRLEATFRALMSLGFARVVVIGSDSPTLPPAIFRRAFGALASGADVVLGPAEDGGYYLAGAKRLLPAMFEGIPWGTGRVLEATLAVLQRSGASVAVLPRWYDIDRPPDLERARLDLYGRAADDEAPACLRAFVERLVGDGRLPLSGRSPAPARGRSRNRSGTPPGTSGRSVSPH